MSATNRSHQCLDLRCRRNGVGFTLIELLVVIAIISLLVSILLPSLERAKQLARTVVCSAQVKSVGTATQMYANDYGSWLPFWRGYVEDYGLTEADNGGQSYLYMLIQQTMEGGYLNLPTDSHTYAVYKDIARPYVLLCPEAKTLLTEGYGASYKPNYETLNYQKSPQSDLALPYARPLYDYVEHPAETMMYHEAGDRFGKPWGAQFYIDRLRFRHNGLNDMVVGFFDSHAATMDEATFMLTGQGESFDYRFWYAQAE